MERISSDSLLLDEPGSEVPGIERPVDVAQTEQADTVQGTRMIDLGRLTLDELMELDTGILGPSLQQVAGNIDDGPVAGFSQGLAY